VKMAAVAKAFAHGFVETKFDAEIARTFAVFCGVALTVFSLVTSYGIDLSPGFF
jgi:ribose/xylose/arabinose/galactoside ABC-type transport system permease subunit